MSAAIVWKLGISLLLPEGSSNLTYSTQKEHTRVFYTDHTVKEANQKGGKRHNLLRTAKVDMQNYMGVSLTVTSDAEGIY